MYAIFLKVLNNDDSKERKNMTVYLSDDDGETWKYKRIIDSRTSLSYPDVDFYNGYIYLTYDFERTGANEILFVKFTEDDIMNDENRKFEATEFKNSVGEYHSLPAK